MTNENTKKYVEEVSIFDVIAIIYQRKIVIFVTMLLCLTLALIWLSVRTVEYTAISTLVPAENQMAGSNQTMPGFSGGAIGQLLGSSSPTIVSEVDKNITKMASRGFIYDFLEENKVPELLINDGHIKVENNTPAETLWEAYDYFMQEVFIISVDEEKGIVTISVTWTEPNTAADWLNSIISSFNLIAKSEANIESMSTIEYLDKTLSETTINERRSILLNLIEQETRNLTISNVNDEYAFRVIDKAIPPVKPSSLRSILIVIGTLVFSFIVGTILSLFYHQWKTLQKIRSE